MKVDAVASEVHYMEHLGPVWRAIPEKYRGSAFYGSAVPLAHKYSQGDFVMVASYSDLRKARKLKKPAILVSHGIGQSYFGDQRTAEHPAYPGGEDHDDVVLFLCPNEQCAYKWQGAYPNSTAAVVGYPKLDPWWNPNLRPTRRTALPSVLFAFNGDNYFCPETRTTFPEYSKAMVKVAHRMETFLTAHPRRIDRLADYVCHEPISVLRDFGTILLHADIVAVDNSSIGWELMALGVPVIWMNAPHYRSEVEHGIRFWEWAGAGIECEDPVELSVVIENALQRNPAREAVTELAVKHLFPFRDNQSSFRAAGAVLSLLKGEL